MAACWAEDESRKSAKERISGSSFDGSGRPPTSRRGSVTSLWLLNASLSTIRKRLSVRGTGFSILVASSTALAHSGTATLSRSIRLGPGRGAGFGSCGGGGVGANDGEGVGVGVGVGV